MFMLAVKKRINKREKRMKGDYYSLGDFPGSPGVKTSPFNAGHAGLIPVLGAKTPHASGGQNIKQRDYHNKIQ